MSETLDVNRTTTRVHRPTVGEDRPVAHRAGGWWGIAFVLLLLVCEAAVTLPLTSHTAPYVRDFYHRYRWPIVVTQLGELLATWFLWRLIQTLVTTVGGQRSGAVRVSGLMVCAGSLLTTLPVLALAAGLGPQDATTALLAGWTDYSDVILSLLIAVFGVACARAALPSWARLAAAALSVTILTHAVLSLLGHRTLNAIAPTAYVAYILAVSVWLLSRGRRRSGQPC
jgi:hypothetical protein